MTYNKQLSLVQTCAETKFLGMIFWKDGRTTGKKLPCYSAVYDIFFPPALFPSSTHPREVFIFIFILSVNDGGKKKKKRNWEDV